jgi:flavin-dependent dehydrogenase
MNVKELLYENGAVAGVRAVDKDGASHEYRAPVTIDCTGRDTFSVSRNTWKNRDPYLNKIAVWTYYKGATRDPGVDEGATTVAYIPDKGWFWYIPLADDIVSCGVVAEKDYLYRDSRDLKTIFHSAVSENKWIEQHLAAGQQFGPYRVTGEYSYRSRYCATDGLVLAGDAFAFLDPVFSSGVFVALRSGELAAETVHEALKESNVTAARFENYGNTMCEGIEAMRKLVYAFYNTEFSFREFLMEYPQLKGDMTDCLMGNLFIDFSTLWNAVAKFIDVPAELSHGRPFTAGEVIAHAADSQASA